MDKFGKRRLWLGGGIVAAIALAALPGPVANISIDVNDSSPSKVEAAIDLGLLGFSVLYTWSQTRALP